MRGKEKKPLKREIKSWRKETRKRLRNISYLAEKGYVSLSPSTPSEVEFLSFIQYPQG